jgi:hypothetical protein
MVSSHCVFTLPRIQQIVGCEIAFTHLVRVNDQKKTMLLRLYATHNLVICDAQTGKYESISLI